MTNIANLFNFISSKKPEYMAPLKFKLLHDPESITNDDLIVKGNLNLYKTPITSLPDNLTVEGYIDLRYTKTTSLPDNLTVGGGINLYDTPISSIPNNLIVGSDIYLANTPLSQKYSKDEILKMIQDKGGSVKGNITI